MNKMRDLMASVILMCLMSCLTAAEKKRRYDPKDLSEPAAKEIFMCIDEVSCVEHKPQEFSKIAEATEECPEVMRDVYEAMLAYGFDFVAYKDDDPWEELSRVTCTMPLQERISRFSDFGATLGNYFQQNKCEIPTHKSDYCSAIEKALVAGEEFIEKFTELGVCNNPRRMVRQGGDTLESGVVG